MRERLACQWQGVIAAEQSQEIIFTTEYTEVTEYTEAFPTGCSASRPSLCLSRTK